jgi:hypothetical protein
MYILSPFNGDAFTKAVLGHLVYLQGYPLPLTAGHEAKNKCDRRASQRIQLIPSKTLQRVVNGERI